MSDQKIKSNNLIIENLKESYKRIGEEKTLINQSLSNELNNKLLPESTPLEISVSQSKDMFEYNTKIDLTYKDKATNSKYRLGNVYFDNISQHRDEEIKSKIKNIIQSRPQIRIEDMLELFKDEKNLLIKTLSEKEVRTKFETDKLKLAFNEVNTFSNELNNKIHDIRGSIVDHYLKDKIYEQKQLYQFQQVFRLGSQNQQLLKQRYQKELEKMYPKPSEGAKERLRKKINGNMNELKLTFDDFSIEVQEPDKKRKNPSMPPQQNTYKKSNALLKTSRYQLIVNRKSTGENRFKLIDLNTGEEKKINKDKAFDMVEKMWQLNKKQRKEISKATMNGFIEFKDLKEKKRLEESIKLNK
tara:strand:- start:14885 stop:15955 length:1071 start_codon:yes stop_codon:yes gene_type:complete